MWPAKNPTFGAILSEDAFGNQGSAYNFDGIDDYYSQSILDELIKRIDTTIDDFNKEFQSLVGNLAVKPKKKNSIEDNQ